MIFSTAEQVIRDSVKDTKYLYETLRQKQINKHLDYYTNAETDKYIKSYFKANAFHEVPPVMLNITSRFINKMARIYRTGATRTANAQYDGLTMYKNIKLKHVERMAKLIGTVACRIGFNERKQMFDYNTVYYYNAFFDENDPMTPVAITYPIHNLVHDVSNSQNMPYAYWDNNKMMIFNSEGKVEQEIPHEYGVLPFAFIHREPQIDQHFVEGASDIVSCNEAINILSLELALGGRFQVFGQPVATGVHADTNIVRAGTDEVILLPDGATFDIVSPKGDLRGLIETIKMFIETCATNNHLSVSFSRSGGEVDSGIALIIKDLERKEDYQDYVDLWMMYENEIYEIERAIAFANGIRLPDNMGVDFNEPEYPRSTQDEVMFNQFMLDNNLTSYSKLLNHYNKDLKVEDASRVIQDNITENNQIRNQVNGTQGQSILSRLRQQTQRAE